MTETKFQNGRTDLTRAAVLVPVFEKDGALMVILTKRSDLVAHHKGQICFPGGVAEDNDFSLWHTALRETNEEIGIGPHGIFRCGKLGEIITPTGFHVTPFVGFVFNEMSFLPNRDEIDDIICAPLDHFFATERYRFETQNYFGEDYNIPHIHYEHHEIWGATARIILDLVERVKPSP